jgi:glutathione synthase
VQLAFLIDPLATLKPKKDSSIALMVEAARRGHEVWIFEFAHVSVENGAIFADATEVRVSPEVLSSSTATTHVLPAGPARRMHIEHFDRVFIRKDPPFDSQYLALTYLLDRPGHEGRFINAPRGIREVNEKLFATRYGNAKSDFTPQTLVTWSFEEAQRFARQYEKVVIKPSYFGSGKGVSLSSHSHPDFASTFATTLALEPVGPVLVQQYLPEGKEGDTRVMLLDGVPLAAVGRRPAPGEFRANIALGGEAIRVEISAEQGRIAVEIGRDLTRLGIVFAGLDFIGDKLIEINVTSPTLMQELQRVSGFDMAASILDRIESRA